MYLRMNFVGLHLWWRTDLILQIKLGDVQNAISHFKNLPIIRRTLLLVFELHKLKPGIISMLRKISGGGAAWLTFFFEVDNIHHHHTELVHHRMLFENFTQHECNSFPRFKNCLPRHITCHACSFHSMNDPQQEIRFSGFFSHGHLLPSINPHIVTFVDDHSCS